MMTLNMSVNNRRPVALVQLTSRNLYRSHLFAKLALFLLLVQFLSCYIVVDAKPAQKKTKHTKTIDEASVPIKSSGDKELEDEDNKESDDIKPKAKTTTTTTKSPKTTTAKSQTTTSGTKSTTKIKTTTSTTTAAASTSTSTPTPTPTPTSTLIPTLKSTSIPISVTAFTKLGIATLPELSNATNITILVTSKKPIAHNGARIEASHVAMKPYSGMVKIRQLQKEGFQKSTVSEVLSLLNMDNDVFQALCRKGC